MLVVENGHPKNACHDEICHHYKFNYKHNGEAYVIVKKQRQSSRWITITLASHL